MTLGDHELAALAHAWDMWARPKQIPPPTGWRSFGYVTGRGFGKTRANAELVIDEIAHGNARRIGIAAQNLDETERVMIHGESGLLRCSPPWFRATVIKGQVVWPNGAIATPYTPEVPAGPRGSEHDLVWLSEVAVWPASTRDEFFSNIRYGLRLNRGRMIFDTTPKRRNPLVRYLLERAQRDPVRHVVVRGSTRENVDNLTAGFVTDLEAEHGGTQRGREELLGEFLDDADGALWRQEWIERARRDMPSTLKRRVIAVDPAISMRAGTDRTGIVELGLGVDEQVFVLADLTDRLAWEVWGALVIDRYTRGGCDCVIVERNRGGDAVVANLRACARERGIRVEVVDEKAPTRAVGGIVYVKETISRRGKELRAEPVASLYERGRVSHVNGADLTELEDVLCLAGGTLVETARGPVPIELVMVGDLVATRFGYRRVRWSGQTGVASTMTIRAGNHEIRCTEGHPVFVQGLFKPARDVRPGDEVVVCRTKSSHSLSSTGAATSDRNFAATTRPVERTASAGSIATFGRPHMGQSPTDTRSTTSMATQATTRSTTCAPSRAASTSDCTDQRASQPKTMQPEAQGAETNGRDESRSATRVCGAGRHSSQPLPSQSTVAVDVVSTRRMQETEPVYNLDVEECPEFFANGILVHNCTWAPEAKGESPDALDALVFGVTELANLSRATPGDGGAAIRGAAAMQAMVAAPTTRGPNIATLLGAAPGRGERI